MCLFFFFKQKTAYEMRISDWSSDVCSSDLRAPGLKMPEAPALRRRGGRTDRRRSWCPENLVGANDRGPVAYLDVAVTLQRFQLCDKPQMFRLDRKSVG